MITTYQEYTKLLKTLSFERMQAIHEQIILEMGTDPDAL